jgi:hypothetical protein
LISYWLVWLVLQQRKKGQYNKWINTIIKSDPAWWSYIISDENNEMNTHEIMTVKQNTNNRHLKFWHW